MSVLIYPILAWLGYGLASVPIYAICHFIWWQIDDDVDTFTGQDIGMYLLAIALGAFSLTGAMLFLPCTFAYALGTYLNERFNISTKFQNFKEKIFWSKS